MILSKITEMWLELEGTTKLMALGTLALVLCSILMTFSTCSSTGSSEGDEANGPHAETAAVQEAEIPADADPIPIASYESRLATTLVDTLAHKDCLWLAVNDELCWMEFTTDGFTEYDGDLTKSATFEIYSIKAIENGREGTWRVSYEDGTVHDASFRFIQDQENGLYTITSNAFPTYNDFQSKAITSEDILVW